MFLRCLSSCDLNLSTEQEDTMRTYLGNLLNILMERHKMYLVHVMCQFVNFTTCQLLKFCIIGTWIFFFKMLQFK